VASSGNASCAGLAARCRRCPLPTPVHCSADLGVQSVRQHDPFPGFGGCQEGNAPRLIPYPRKCAYAAFTTAGNRSLNARTWLKWWVRTVFRKASQAVRLSGAQPVSRSVPCYGPGPTPMKTLMTTGARSTRLMQIVGHEPRHRAGLHTRPLCAPMRAGRHGGVRQARRATRHARP